MVNNARLLFKKAAFRRMQQYSLDFSHPTDSCIVNQQKLSD